MRAIERLRRDHQILRSKLNVLEGALGMGPETWFVLREVCFTLSKQLRDHIKREEGLVAACRQAMDPKVLASVAVEHHDEPEHLRTINRLFVQESSHTLERIKPALTTVIEGLRHHMDQEEVALFPILEQVLAAQEAPAEGAPMSPHALDETMTVNLIIQQYPNARRVFERLFVNVPVEGCTCLDETAWRHGMDSQELLQSLEQVIASCACRGSEASKRAESAPETEETMTCGKERERKGGLP